MTPEEIIKAIYKDGPWVSDAEEGTYCFFCHRPARWAHGYGYGPKFEEHDRDCLWIEIEKQLD